MYVFAPLEAIIKSCTKCLNIIPTQEKKQEKKEVDTNYQQFNQYRAQYNTYRQPTTNDEIYDFIHNTISNVYLCLCATLRFHSHCTCNGYVSLLNRQSSPRQCVCLSAATAAAAQRKINSIISILSLAFIRTNDLCIWNYDNNKSRFGWVRCVPSEAVLWGGSCNAGDSSSNFNDGSCGDGDDVSFILLHIQRSRRFCMCKLVRAAGVWIFRFFFCIFRSLQSKNRMKTHTKKN